VKSRSLLELYSPGGLHQHAQLVTAFVSTDAVPRHDKHDAPRSGNLRAVQLLLGHTKMDSTVRYLGVELEDALAIAEAIEI